MAVATTPGQTAAVDGRAWHTLTPDAALTAQHVAEETGLSAAEVTRRREQYGPNRLAEEAKQPAWRQFLDQYRDPMQLVLVGAGVISAVPLGQWGTAALLLALTVLNAVMGLHQEGKAEASVAALQKMMLVTCRVRRDGNAVEVPAEELVPGDIVLLEAGDRVPADGRIVRAATLEIDESALTGESAPVPKQVDPVADPDTPLGDRVDLAFMNTNVTRGAGEIVVTATGMATELGHISGMLKTTEIEKTPLTRQLDRLTGQIVAIAGVALLASIAMGAARGLARDVLFTTAVAFAVAAIPTGLPAVVTFLLATGTTTLARAGAIVKRLRSVETLGATSAINSDKTGTLTLNQMTAVEMVVPGRRFTVDGGGYATAGRITHVAGTGEVDLDPYLLPMALASDATVRDGTLVGDPTEGAMVVLAAKGGIDAVATRAQYPRLGEVPFDAAYKLMATFHEMPGGNGRPVVRCYVKGAPDALLARATQILDADQHSVAVAKHRQAVLEANRRLAEQGLRVMAVAHRDVEPKDFHAAEDLLKLVDGLTMLALVGIVDPPRAEVRDAIAEAKEAGIRVRMITGDHAVTAGAIARDLGIEGEAISGTDFAALDDAAVQQRLDDIGVIARVTPEQKVRLVDALRSRNLVVAMTGDGVNDAPALKKADIGVAMGVTGTDVAKEAAVMILTDDNFATIVRAVRLGRGLYDNLMKYIRFQMGVLFGMIATFLGAGIFNVLSGAPLLPFQTLYVNFTTQVFVSIGLGMGEPAPGLMQRRPRDKDAPVLPRRLGARLLAYGLLIGGATLLVIHLAAQSLDDTTARTMGLVTFSLFNLFFALATADEHHSMFTRDFFANRMMVKMSAYSLLAIYLVTGPEFMQRLFRTSSLDVTKWMICVAVAAIVVVVSEVEKLVRRQLAARSSTSLSPAPSPS